MDYGLEELVAWFKVDDGLHDHRKTRKVRRSHPDKQRDVAPFGLWVLAGSWAGANGTGGFVPTEVLLEWDDDAVQLARRLVTAGLWWPTVEDGEPGYGFHDWDDRNPAGNLTGQIDQGRFGNHLRWHVNREIVKDDCEFCRPDSGGDIGGESGGDIATNRLPDSSRPVPTRPDPTDKPCASADAEREFDEWYSAYPRKRGKGQAQKAYRAARKKTDAETLLTSLRQQRGSLVARGSEFVPYPATWLNGERWADEPDGTAAPSAGDDWMRRRPS